jgi:hypothetical protein
MKIQIDVNSVRFILTEAELARLESGGEVAEIIHFGPELQGNLRYSLVIAEQPVPVAVGFLNSAITISITPEQLSAWSEDGQVGVYAKLDVGPTGPLEVAIEVERGQRD